MELPLPWLGVSYRLSFLVSAREKFVTVLFCRSIFRRLFPLIYFEYRLNVDGVSFPKSFSNSTV